VSWERIADSLFFTGFSVPLLDFLVKTVILDRGFSVNTATNPVGLYTFMALANGIYLSTHNAFRGLPRAAVIGNFFRSVLSIPIAILFNALIGLALAAAGVPGAEGILQKWAAIISKLASDLVAGFIEGTADRHHNIRSRMRDYRSRFTQIFDAYSRLEILFPEAKVMEILESPEKFRAAASERVLALEKIIIITALDLLYFWMYQPRARTAMRTLLDTMSPDERRILIRTQFILLRKRAISLLFVDGFLGRNFSRALAFYLERSGEYLDTLTRMRTADIPLHWKEEIGSSKEYGEVA